MARPSSAASCSVGQSKHASSGIQTALRATAVAVVEIDVDGELDASVGGAPVGPQKGVVELDRLPQRLDEVTKQLKKERGNAGLPRDERANR